MTVKRVLVDDRPKSFEDCVAWACNIFSESYHNTIAQLLYNFPPDQVYCIATHSCSISAISLNKDTTFKPLRAIPLKNVRGETPPWKFDPHAPSLFSFLGPPGPLFFSCTEPPLFFQRPPFCTLCGNVPLIVIKR